MTGESRESLGAAPHSKYQHVYPVVRWDSHVTGIETQITVTKVFRSEPPAREEAERLNSLNHEKGCIYFVTLSRLVEDS